MVKNPWIAGILSLIIAGLGHVYVGRMWRGLAFLSFEILTAALLEAYFEVALVLNSIVSIIAAVDAFMIAKKSGTIPQGAGDDQVMREEIRIY
ncbi:hypothetical protein ACFLRF_04705 [Candidatus Altiarchaeota archaeon]